MGCPACGSDNMTRKEGVSKKTGKPYVGFKCNDCGEMKFLNDSPAKKTFPAAKPQQHAETNGKETMIMSYAKDVVVAMMQKKDISDPWAEVVKGYRIMIQGLKPKPEPKPQDELDNLEI